MSTIDFGRVKDELSDAEYMHVFQVLVRESLLTAAGNRPATLIATDKTIYFGGTKELGGKFKRITKKSINTVQKRGKLVWESIEVNYLGLEGEQKIYICPFTGTHTAPLKDRESMEELYRLLRENK